MKTKEELNALKEEVETLNKKLHELTEEELERVVGGNAANQDSKIFINGTSCERLNLSMIYVTDNKS